MDKQNLPVSEQSVFNLPEFPHKTRKILCKPNELKQMLEEYANYDGDIEQMTAKYHINLHTFLKLCKIYPEIEQEYRSAQVMRAEHLGADTVRIADDADDDLIMQQRGDSTYFAPNVAAVRRAECRIRTRQYLMERYNPEKYSPRTKVEQTTRALHLHAVTQLPPVTELESIGLDGLQDIQRSMRYGDSASQQSGATRR